MSSSRRAVIGRLTRFAGQLEEWESKYKGAPTKQGELELEDIYEDCADYMEDHATRSESLLVTKSFRRFSRFKSLCTQGKRIKFEGTHFVAVDRKTWNDMQRALEGKQKLSLKQMQYLNSLRSTR